MGNYSDKRGDKPSQAGKEGLKHPMGSGHWEKKIPETEVADTRYCSEMNAEQELSGQVNKLASYVKKNKMQYN